MLRSFHQKLTANSQWLGRTRERLPIRRTRLNMTGNRCIPSSAKRLADRAVAGRQHVAGLEMARTARIRCLELNGKRHRVFHGDSLIGQLRESLDARFGAINSAKCKCHRELRGTSVKGSTSKGGSPDRSCRRRLGRRCGRRRTRRPPRLKRSHRGRCDRGPILRRPDR